MAKRLAGEIPKSKSVHPTQFREEMKHLVGMRKCRFQGHAFLSQPFLPRLAGSPVLVVLVLADDLHVLLDLHVERARATTGMDVDVDDV